MSVYFWLYLAEIRLAIYIVWVIMIILSFFSSIRAAVIFTALLILFPSESFIIDAMKTSFVHAESKGIYFSEKTRSNILEMIKKGD